MHTPTPFKQLVIAQRPVFAQLYEDEDGVWVRLGKYFSDMQLSLNTASKMAALYAKDEPKSNLFRQANFAGSAISEWCVNLTELEPYLRKRRKNVVTAYLWRLYDAWTAFATRETSLNNESEPTKKTKSKSVERRLNLQSVSDLNISVNALD